MNALPCLFAIFTTILAGCSTPMRLQSNQPQAISDMAPYDYQNLAFSSREIESASWVSTDGNAVHYLSGTKFHVLNHREIYLAFYGFGDNTNGLNIYFNNDINGYTLIGHEYFDGNIVDANVVSEGARVFIELARANKKHNGRYEYSYELKPNYTLAKDLSSFIFRN